MKSRSRFITYVLTSITFHVVFFLLLFAISTLKIPSSTPESAVEISLLTPEEIRLLQDKEDSKVIVQSDANEQITVNAKFYGEKNNAVAKETKAKRGETFTNATKPGSENKSAQQAQKAVKPKPTNSKLFDQDFDPYATLVKQDMARELKKFSKEQAATGPGSTPTTNDHLANVDESLVTKLNTKEYKYYGYYHRMRIQLNQWWQPKVREKFAKIIRRDRTIASEADKITRLVIILDNKGTLMKVQVIGESGFRDLDDAAVEAFRAAAPFPNPPKGIIESDGTVKIRWDFVIES
ncbi:MAG: hypothetical protein A2622_06765 [Bdellovibrionales bacterium RIFCSPHIGHO2_01_FULL_40_29]|nr:MAG: hypothetical protein A2622_06765 [Bdellovibrionales bacterium RIFCSPHIGHO2_01_FULL_40_29]OFZ35142.1 MAG: hypothetical protein A3D17_07115 [Bdellovibrionales bacterium RIFCSPHIGHO2_02_FULL_40_15]